ncbi:MAG: hypothetical protein LBU36_04400 [Clostridiales bacterium]|jgi:hypothetical protein|nr:hypothetical protein [Clostridiales bacterium]
MIDAFFTREATVFPYIGTSGRGEAIYGEPYKKRGRFLKKAARRGGKLSRENLNAAVAYFPAGTRIPLNSKIICGGETYRLSSLEIKIGLDEHHVKAALGKA